MYVGPILHYGFAIRIQFIVLCIVHPWIDFAFDRCTVSLEIYFIDVTIQVCILEEFQIFFFSIKYKRGED